MALQKVENIIHEARGLKVMLDYDLAKLYEVETKALNQAVKRNVDRFPEDFMFRLTPLEWGTMWSQIVTGSDNDSNQSQIVTGSLQKHRGIAPYAFTEQGIAMLSGVLKSKKAIEVNISIMRTFVFMRQYALSHKDLSEKLKRLEEKFDTKFKDIHDAITYLIQKDVQQKEHNNRKQLGYK
jgi:hypothetical protein